MFFMFKKLFFRNVCRKFFGPATGFVEMITQHIPSPVTNGLNKVTTTALYSHEINKLKLDIVMCEVKDK